MTDEEHLWACAIEVEKQHGAGAISFANGRRVDLAMAGDQAGCDRWEAIAARLAELTTNRERTN
jgi:hypothetical protein